MTGRRTPGDDARAEPAPEQLSLFPHQLRPGDLVTEGGEEYEIVAQPQTVAGGRTVTARVRRPGATVTTSTAWPAYQRVQVRRAPAA